MGKTTGKIFRFISVHHFPCVSRRETAAAGVTGGTAERGGWGLPREAVVAMARWCDAEAARGRDHITRTHGILRETWQPNDCAVVQTVHLWLDA